MQFQMTLRDFSGYIGAITSLKCCKKGQGTHGEDPGRVEGAQEEGEEDQVSLRLLLVHVHQTQLGQLAHHRLQALALQRPHQPHLLGLSLRRLVPATSLRPVPIRVPGLREADFDRFLLVALLPSRHLVGVTHHLNERHTTGQGSLTLRE